MIFSEAAAGALDTLHISLKHTFYEEMHGNQQQMAFVMEWWLRGFDQKRKIEALTAAGYKTATKNGSRIFNAPQVKWLVDNIVRVYGVTQGIEDRALILSKMRAVMDSTSTEPFEKIQAAKVIELVLTHNDEERDRQEKALERARTKMRESDSKPLSVDEMKKLRVLMDEEIARAESVGTGGAARLTKK